MKIGMVTLALAHLSLEQAFRTASEIGFKAIELMAREPHFCGKFKPEAIAKVKGLLKANNLKMSVYGSYWKATGHDVWQDDLKNAEEVLSIAKEFGTPIVRVWAPGLDGKGSVSATSKVMNNSAVGLKKFSRLAADFGLKVAVEMHVHTLIDSLASIKQILEMTDEPNFGLNFQPIVMEGFDGPVNVVRAIGEKIFLCHAGNFCCYKEWPSIQDDSMPLSNGITDWKAIISELHKIGYEGHIEIEHVKPTCAVEQLKEDYLFLTKCIATL